MARLTGSLNVQGSIDASSITGSLDWDTLVNVPAGIMSSSTGFIEASQTASMTVGTANTASYVTSSNVDGEVYRAERARRIEVGSYGSYSNLTDIPFITGDYGSSIKRLSADGALQWHAGTNHLTVQGVNATQLTGSLDWNSLDNVPEGIMSSSNGIVPLGTVSSSAQIVASLPDGTISGSDQVDLTDLDGDDLKFNTRAICAVFGGTSLGNVYSESRGNVAVGYCAMRGVSTPADLEQNTAMGLCAGYNVNSDSINNVFLGHGAAGCNTNCHNGNIAIGSFAMRCGGGTSNIALGGVAGEDMTGDYNIILGSLAARDPFTGDSNIVIGAIAGRCLSGAAGYNILLGYNAGSTSYFPKAAYNVAQSGSVVAITAGTGTEPNIHGRFNAWGGVKDYFQINAPVTASSFEAASLTGSLNWDDLNNVPSGILSSSVGIVSTGTISSSAQITAHGFISESSAAPSGTISSSAQITAHGFISESVSIPSGTVSSSAQIIAGLPAHTVSASNAQAHINAMGGYQESGSIRFGREDGINRYHEIKGYNTSVAANNWMTFNVHNGTQDETIEVLRLKGDGKTSGSFIGDGSGLTGLASYTLPDDVVSSSAQIDYTGIQNIPISASNPATPILNIITGSTDRRIVALGNNVLTAAASASNIPYGSIVIGYGAGAGMNAGIIGSDNIVMGRDAMGNDGSLIENCVNHSVYIGNRSGFSSGGEENVAIGGQSMTSGSGHFNTSVGTWSGNGPSLRGCYNTMIGNRAGGSDTAATGLSGDSDKNTIIGADAGLNSGSANVLIGYGAGNINSNFDNKLKIENGVGGTLIGGDFSTGVVEINDILQLNEIHPLPSGDKGMLAVSASLLYFHNGTSWSSIS